MIFQKISFWGMATIILMQLALLIKFNYEMLELHQQVDGYAEKLKHSSSKLKVIFNNLHSIKLATAPRFNIYSNDDSSSGKFHLQAQNNKKRIGINYSITKKDNKKINGNGSKINSTVNLISDSLNINDGLYKFATSKPYYFSTIYGITNIILTTKIENKSISDASLSYNLINTRGKILSKIQFECHEKELNGNDIDIVFVERLTGEPADFNPLVTPPRDFEMTGYIKNNKIDAILRFHELSDNQSKLVFRFYPGTISLLNGL